ncbi:DUF4405 domain-containing protein [Derxia gummosa]|uniref:DUF4405 domain-containing protein n=1 Tax=Derxia gummosa DSM 723 TaxID=1121388 RepID=A0A8B6X7Q0_9BURK|nr:DUF4405 domain-containing protein [Derxia gummosa]
MNRTLRDWATPLTIGSFALMAVTGGLMFFHLDRGLQKPVHEWAGWLMAGAGVLHGVVNWSALKRYLRLPRPATVMGLCVLALGASFFVGADGDRKGGGSPSVIAMQAIAGAPIGSVAPLFGKTGAEARAALAAADISLPDDDATLASAIGAERDRLGKALRALSARP